MSHPRPPAQPFSCLPSRCRQPAALLSVGTPRQSPTGTGHPPSPAAGWGRWGNGSPPRAVPSTRVPCAPHRHIPTKGCCSRAILPSSCSQPRSHRSRARTPGTNQLRRCPGSSPRDSPLPRPAGSPGGFQGGPCPCPHTRTHTRRPPNDRQGLEKGWGVFTVPRAASAGPDAAPGRRPPLPPASSARASLQAARWGAALRGKLRHGEGAPLRDYRQSLRLLPPPGC